MEKVLAIPSVTGVDLSLQVAGPGARSFAFIVDWHIRFLAAVAWFLIGTLLLFGTIDLVEVVVDQTVFVFVVLVPVLAIYFLYHPVLEVVMGGRTPGKRIAHVRVITADGGVPGVGALLTRNIFRLIDSLPLVYCIGLTFTLFTEHAVRIGDIAAGTLLVYDEQKHRSIDELSGAGLSRIGIEQAELVRDLVERWSTLNPAMRARLGQSLLAKLGETPAIDGDRQILAALRSILKESDEQP